MTPRRPVIELVCASANPGKVAELQELLDDRFALLPRPTDVPDVAEDADSLVGNARLKANAIAAATGMPAIADDTGLFVAALDGLPGVRTARFAGEHATAADNRVELLARLAGFEDRSARFRTVAVVAWPDGRELTAEGECEGRIADEQRGDRGFGYDAVFVPSEGDGRSFAEMSAADKHDLSHRGRAVRRLIALLTTP